MIGHAQIPASVASSSATACLAPSADNWPVTQIAPNRKKGRQRRTEARHEHLKKGNQYTIPKTLLG